MSTSAYTVNIGLEQDRRFNHIIGRVHINKVMHHVYLMKPIVRIKATIFVIDLKKPCIIFNVRSQWVNDKFFKMLLYASVQVFR